MVVGNGLLAQTFLEYKDDKEILIFASGVSDSTTKDSNLFDREFRLLCRTLESNPNVKFVYFSTVSINDSSVNKRKYNSHKIIIEDYIKSNSNNYLILRVSNVVGPNGNSNTIINFLVNAVKNDKKLTIWKNAERNIIDKDDLLFIVKNLIKKETRNKTINVAVKKSISVLDILKLIETYFNKKVAFDLINKGSKLDIDVSLINKELKIIESKSGSGKNYIWHVINKYY